MWSLFVLLILMLSMQILIAIPVDNGVEGEPEVECGPKTIRVSFNTRNDFSGHLYVKVRFKVIRHNLHFQLLKNCW